MLKQRARRIGSQVVEHPARHLVIAAGNRDAAIDDRPVVWRRECRNDALASLGQRIA